MSEIRKIEVVRLRPYWESERAERVYERHAARLAFSWLQIGQCRKCGHPFVEGYICPECHDGSPNREGPHEGMHSDELVTIVDPEPRKVVKLAPAPDPMAEVLKELASTFPVDRCSAQSLERTLSELRAKARVALAGAGVKF